MDKGLLTHLERYIRLESIDKLSVATTFIIVAGVLFALGTSAIFFISTGLVQALSIVVGNEALGYFIVGGLLVVVMVVFYMNRKRWVEDKVVRSISRSILDSQIMDTEKGGSDEED